MLPKRLISVPDLYVLARLAMKVHGMMNPKLVKYSRLLPEVFPITSDRGAEWLQKGHVIKCNISLSSLTYTVNVSFRVLSLQEASVYGQIHVRLKDFSRQETRRFQITTEKERKTNTIYPYLLVPSIMPQSLSLELRNKFPHAIGNTPS